MQFTYDNLIWYTAICQNYSRSSVTSLNDRGRIANRDNECAYFAKIQWNSHCREYGELMLTTRLLHWNS